MRAKEASFHVLAAVIRQMLQHWLSRILQEIADPLLLLSYLTFTSCCL
jgi:hypothetical protein